MEESSSRPSEDEVVLLLRRADDLLLRVVFKLSDDAVRSLCVVDSLTSKVAVDVVDSVALF